MANYGGTNQYNGLGGYTKTENGWAGPPYSRDGRQGGFQATLDHRPTGFADTGTPFEEVPVSVGSSPSGWSISSFLGWGGRTNTNAQAEGVYSAGGTRVAGNRRSHGGPKSAYPSDIFESKDVNGDYSQSLGDLPRVPVQGETSTNELKVLHLEIAKLENLNKKLEEECFESLKKFHSEKLRADDFEIESRHDKGELQGLKERAERDIREIQRKLQGLHREKERADAFEKDNREIRRKLDGEKVRADAFEKENREIKRELESLSLEKVRADNLESENRAYQAKLKQEEQEVGELQSKLQDALAAKELEVAEFETLENSLKTIRLENQELNRWKLERERKTVQDTSSAGQFRTKIADLTYSKGQLEMREQQLTKQAQEQAKRIEDLKQQNSVLVVKMGASESQVKSLLERLRDEREKLQQRNIEVEELRQHLKPPVIIAGKEAQVDDQESREDALKAQCSLLEQQVQSKESEIQSLSLTLSKLNERLRECDLEIDDLKHQVRDRENRDSQEFAVTSPKPYVGGESFLESEATPYLLDRAVQRVHEGAGIFSRLLMKAMEQGKIDGMAVARNNFVRSISVGKAAPLKYVLEAIMCKLLFQSFEHECFDLQDSTSGFLDMEQQRMDNFRQYKYLNSIEFPEQLVLTDDGLFTHFCRIKLESLSAAIPEIESMVQEIICRTFDRSFSSDDTSTDVATYLASKLGSTFVKLAVCVWQVHKLAFAFNPVARIFRVAQSEKFVEKYMESVIFQESESEDEDVSAVDISRVDFMVVPGFLINRIVIRSRVFVVTKPMLSAFQYRSGEIQPPSK